MKNNTNQIRVTTHNRTSSIVPSGWSSWHKNSASAHISSIQCNYKNGSSYVKDDYDTRRINIKDSDIID